MPSSINSKDQISRMAAMDGTAYDIYYNAQRMPLYAKSAEGQRSYFWYNKKGTADNYVH